MSSEEMKYIIALIQLPGIGVINKKILLEEFGSAKSIFEEILNFTNSPYFKKKIINKIVSFNE